MYLNATEAAAELGISRTTLYAYVSRRGIRSIAVEGSKERLYWKDDVLHARRAKGRPPRSEAAPSPTTSLSLISDTGLFYRGVDAVALAEKATVEDTAALLWDLPVEELFTARVPVFPPLARKIARLTRGGGDGADRALAALPLIEAANPRAYDFSHAGLAGTGADVLRSVAAIMLGDEQARAEPIHEGIGRQLDLSDEVRDLLRRMLVLSADHGFEPSSVAVRAVASIGVSPYRSVAAGLLLLTGRRTQLGRIDGLDRLLDEIGAGEPEAAILRRLKEGDRLPGFGFHAYSRGDPRGHALMEALEAVLGPDPRLKGLKSAIAVVHDALGLWPDYALIAQFAMRAFLPDQRTSLFVLGRCVGWIAHAIEQYRSGEAIRPTTIYTGPLPRGGE